MNFETIIVFITAPSSEVADEIAEVLLEGKLAACVNVIPGVRSIYTWKGKREVDQEVLMVVKSRAVLFENKLVPAVQKVHPYDVPEIIALPVVLGSQSYLEWVQSETSHD